MCSSNAGLPAWSQRLISELENMDWQAKALADALTLEQLNWSPRPDAWSVGQCLQHLYITNKVYLLAMSRSLQSQKQSGTREIIVGWFGRWFIRNYIEPSSKMKRLQAPKKIKPQQQVELSILKSFLQSNLEARQFVFTASAYDVNRIRFKNPFVPMIRFTVGTGLEIVSKHQKRHLLQAERVIQSAGFPGEKKGQ